MMREIKFRGKKIDTGEWLHGHYFIYDDSHNIVPPRYSSKPSGYFLVDENTVGQFIGIKDKNGKDIYENDVVKYYQPYAKRWDTHIVKWDEEFAAFGMFEDGSEWYKENDWMKIEEIEVVGNIHDIK